VDSNATCKAVKIFKIIFFLTLTFLSGCATTPTRDEPQLTIKLKGTAVEVQHFIEDRVRSRNSKIQIEGASDRELILKTDCIDIPDLSSFKCAIIMMAVGNSGWSGPYLVMRFRTAEIRGEVNVALTASWCATNAFGRTNCGSPEPNVELNSLLRKIEVAYNGRSESQN